MHESSAHVPQLRRLTACLLCSTLSLPLPLPLPLASLSLPPQVVEPLEEAQLSPADIRAFLACCLHVARALPDNARAAATAPSPLPGGDGGREAYIFDPKALTKAEQLRLDWLRFVAFSRLCIDNYI